MATLVLPALRQTANEGTAERSVFGDLVIVVFVTAQILDGMFTYLGIKFFGPTIEANPLLFWMIHTVGEIPALAAAKGLALGLGAFLHLASVHRVVAVLAGLYIAAAVIPWTSLLFF
jgi:hypothetical protein